MSIESFSSLRVAADPVADPQKAGSAGQESGSIQGRSVKPILLSNIIKEANND